MVRSLVTTWAPPSDHVPELVQSSMVASATTRGLVQLTDVNFYVRGLDPTAIADVTLAGLNIPIRIGEATILPGDVVLGTPTGIIFIPSHLVQEVVEYSEDIRVRDEFGKQRLDEGKYTSGEIDVPVWREDIEADFQQWKREQQK